MIADICISSITVRHHLTSIFDKLGVSNRQKLLIRAHQIGASNVQVADPRNAAHRAARHDHRQGARRAAGVNPADIIRELIKSGIFATINQVIDRDTASLVATSWATRSPRRSRSTSGVTDRGRGRPAGARPTKDVLIRGGRPVAPPSRAPPS